VHGEADDLGTVRAELEALRRENARLRANGPDTGRGLHGGDLDALLDGLPALVFLFDAEDRYLDHRSAGGVALYAPPAAFLGRRVDEVIEGPVGTELRRALQATRASGTVATFEYALPMPAGLRHYEARLVPLAGGRVGALCVDVTPRVTAEKALRESEERFRLAFKTSPDAIAINRAADGGYVAANDGFARLLGWTEGEILGRSSLELGIWVDPADRQRLVEQLSATGSARLETRFRRRDGSVGTGLMSATALALDGVPHVLSVTRDRTEEVTTEAERRRLEDALRQSQKLEAVGRLAGGIAHDFNNLLTGISGNVGLALLEAGAEDPARPLLLEIEDVVRRAAALTRQLLAFASRQPMAPRPVALGATLVELQRLLGRLIGEEVALTLDLDPALPPVLADPGQVEQVVVNLVVNARDAIAGRGRIVLATSAVAVETGTPDRPAGRYARLSVRDDGAGMDPAVLAHVFEPFFSTKGGKGTGLGLATVYGIVRRHGGFVEVTSAPGQGSTFEVHLPLAPAGAGAGSSTPPSATGAPLSRGSETVLLIEDEAVVRDAARTLLARLGYRVLPAASGAEALAAARAHAGPIHLVVTDVMMPGMSGAELWAALRPERPATRVLFMTGYGGDAIAAAGLDADGVQILGKPFTVEALARRIRELLDAAAVRPG
jgi:PAS domain S-box-containing protein